MDDIALTLKKVNKVDDFEVNLNKEKVDFLMNEAENKKMISIDLEEQIIFDENHSKIEFEIDSFRKKCLLEGLDDIALTLKKINKIDDFELNLSKSHPWIV